jgi:diaminopimelate decarboxylase
MNLPGAPYLTRDGSELRLDGCSLAALAREFGTPLYVYSQRAMLAALDAYQRALGGRAHLLCYAMKANPSLAVLQSFARAGCGFDIVSGGELQRVLAAGGDASRVVFSGVGKTRAEMRGALHAGVRCFNVESPAELELLSQVASAEGCTAPVSLRVNPDVDAGTHPYISTGLKDNKFGIAHDQALATYRRAAALPGLRVAGIDCHIGSQITQVAPYLDALDRLLDLVEAIEAEGIPIEHLDLGGGLGITYTDETPPPADELVRQLLQRIDARGHGHRELLLEPGRSLVGNAGVLLTEVLYLKPGASEELLHRRRGDERPDAPGDVPGLDGDRALHRARCHRDHLGRGGPGVRIGRLAGPRPRAGGAAGRHAGRAVGRRLRHGDGQQLQHTARALPR